MSVSMWKRDEDENEKEWTRAFATRAAALEFLSKYLDQLNNIKKKTKEKSLSPPLP